MLQLICFSVATCIAVLEQLMDVFTTHTDTAIAAAAAASSLWLQAKMFLFQYSATNPQIVQLINGIIQYPVVDPTLCVVTACSVTTTTSNNVTIKFAVGSPLQAASAPVVASAQGYINYMGTAGISYNLMSLNPDQIYINANIWYQGQYASTILTTLTAAITAFLQNLSTPNAEGTGLNLGGVVQMSALLVAIKAVPGVNDAELLNVSARSDATAYGNGVQLILNTAILQTQWAPIAGYTIPEQTAGYTLATSLNLIAQ